MKRENAGLAMLHVIGLTGPHLAQPRDMRSSSCLRVAFPRVVDITASPTYFLPAGIDVGKDSSAPAMGQVSVSNFGSGTQPSKRS